MPAGLAIVGIIEGIRLAMKTSSELAPSIANDVSIWRQVFGSGNNKKQLQALRAQSVNSAAQLGSLITQMRADLDASRDAVAAQLAALQEKFGADGSISVEEFAGLVGMQGIANSIGNGYRHLQALDTLRQQLEAASAAPNE